MKVYLVGYKNSGKTTTGKKLAKRLAYSFLDLDELIERMNGNVPVPDLYREHGESIFREMERDALHQTKGLTDVVISTGGGAPRFFDNMEFMNSNGITVYLNLDNDTLVGRLKKATLNRPVVQGKTSEELYDYVRELKDKFEHFYLSSKIVIDAKNLSPDEIVSKIEL